MNSKLTITIGIPAYNEESNIGNLLRTIIEQQVTDNILREVLVFSDGSDDKTVSISKSFKDKKITVYDDKKRRGQGYRMNQIMHEAKGDIIIFLDADVILGSNDSIEKLANAFKIHEDIGLVGGNAVPLPGKTFTEKAVSITTSAYEEIKKTVRGGNNIFGVTGRVLAIKSALGKGISIPPKIFATDAYLYFSCLKAGQKFFYVDVAIVRYRSPATVKDQIKQNTRFNASPHILVNIFGDIVRQEYSIPKKLYMKVVARHFMHHPIYSSYIFLINLYTKSISSKQARLIKVAWQVSETTKAGITNVSDSTKN